MNWYLNNPENIIFNEYTNNSIDDIITISRIEKVIIFLKFRFRILNTA